MTGSTGRTRFRVVWWLVLPVFASCSSMQLGQTTRPYIVSGDYAAGLDAIAGVESDSDRLLVLLERGLFNHYRQDYVASNLAFEEAEALIDERYTKSLSQEALALVTTDRVRPYQSPDYERVMLNVYRSLNYVGLNLPDDALVEARKANANLALFASRYPDPDYIDDAFVQFLGGLLYEWQEEWNDAAVSYRNAAAAYESAATVGGPAVPRALTTAYARVVARLGFDDEVQRIRERYPPIADEVRSATDGEVIIIVETGFAPDILARRIDVPILKSDSRDRGHVWHVAHGAYGRIGHRYEAPELAYLLSISYPVLHDTPNDVRAVVVRGRELDFGLERVGDVAFNARRNFEDRKETVIVRTIARALLKYLAKETANDIGGNALGFVVDILGSVTEQADTRSWSNLPRDVFLGRERLPAGTHEVSLRALDANGREVGRTAAFSVDVRPGEMTWVSFRF